MESQNNNDRLSAYLYEPVKYSQMTPEDWKNMKKYVIEFEAPDDWMPMMENGCWWDCPFSSLTKLGNICNAKEAYDRSGLVICPVIRLAKTKQERGKRADLGIYEDWQGKAVED